MGSLCGAKTLFPAQVRGGREAGISFWVQTRRTRPPPPPPPCVCHSSGLVETLKMLLALMVSSCCWSGNGSNCSQSHSGLFLLNISPTLKEQGQACKYCQCVNGCIECDCSASSSFYVLLAHYSDLMHFQEARLLETYVWANIWPIRNIRCCADMLQMCSQHL